MVRRTYVPDRGDAVWLQFDPQAGHEQAGRRPALVLSPAAYNGKVGLAVLCPITSQSKGYPFEVPIVAAPGTKVNGNADAEIERLRKEVERGERMLANERFVANAKPDVVDAERPGVAPAARALEAADS